MSSTSSIGDSAELEGNLTLADRLKAFKSSQFDPDAYITSKCQNMNEKAIRNLCSVLADLKKASAEEMRRSVYANYSAFIRTSREISNLEGQLLSLRNFLLSRSALIHNLSEALRVNSIWADHEQSLEDDASANREFFNGDERILNFIENLDVLLAEKRVEEAMDAIEDAETLLSSYPSLENAIVQRRQRLADHVSETATRGGELRHAVSAVKRLGDASRAHRLLLHSHQKRLDSSIQRIKLSNKTAFTVALSQAVFSAIAQAASDSFAVLGDEPAYTSALVTWAVNQTESFSLLLRSHVSFDLRTVSECVQIALGHCSLLEARGLTLSPVIIRQFKPTIETALASSLRQINQTTTAFASTENWVLAKTAPSHHHLSPSAAHFGTSVHTLLDSVASLAGFQIDAQALSGVHTEFLNYITLMTHALPGGACEDDSPTRIVKPAENESQQLALLANASLLADEILPRAAAKLRVHVPLDFKKKLQRSVDKLRDTFCRMHALDVMFTEEGDPLLSAEIYTSLDGLKHEPQWFPSPVFQTLFGKVGSIARLASEIFVGRERFATLLLMRLTDTIVLWLSDDEAFWREIEEVNRLGAFGLQQLYLDMEFVLLFASQGRFLSRHMHQVVKNIIARAIEASGLDPYSELPKEEWFVESAQMAIDVLTGRGDFDGIERMDGGLGQGPV